MLQAVASRTLRSTGSYGLPRLRWSPPRAGALSPHQCAKIDFPASSSIFRCPGSWGRCGFSSGRGATDRYSLEGRYGYALHAAAQAAKALEQVHADVQGLREAFHVSRDFSEFAKTSGIAADTKVSVVQQIADRFKLHKITKNFLCTVAENKRMDCLPKILSSFEQLYRATRGEIRCFVTSAQELTSGQKKDVIASLQKRAGPKATILAEFNTSPSIAGGLLVRMGDEVLDYTIATRVESLRSSLLAPINA